MVAPPATSSEPLSPLTLPFSVIGPADLPTVGGKGANLGALAAAGFPVPPGFCVTTHGYRRFLEGVLGLEARFAALDALSGEDVEAARLAASAMRETLSAAPLPEDVAERVLVAFHAVGPEEAYAVRSSATAEDLPGASFAGQQDTYLNIRGEAALLDAVRRCWISLFTDRAVLYRARGGFGHRAIALSVVVQRMVFPDASGILFTADPISGHRGILSIDAGFGLGEALVSGLISADLYKVDKHSGALRELSVGDKAMAIRALPEGGTREETLDEARRKARVLDDGQVAELARLGLAIEQHYGGVPQDVEWCLADGKLYVVQARPITSLFPMVPTPADGRPHVFLHFGHLQMMTEPMSPMGRDLWRVLVPLGKTDPSSPLSQVVVETASRLFVDPTLALRIVPVRQRLLGVLGHVYSPAAELLEAWCARPELRQDEVGRPSGKTLRGGLRLASKVVPRLFAAMFLASTEDRVARFEGVLSALLSRVSARMAEAKDGVARLDTAMEQLAIMLPSLVPVFAPELASAIFSQRWLERSLAGRASPEDLAALGRGLSGNVTTEMDQRVADLADRVRGLPELEALLRERPDAARLATAGALPGGAAFLAELNRFLADYGMRAAGEIDVARTRWRDDPSLVIAAVLGNLGAGGEPGAHRARHRSQAAEAEAAVARLQQAVAPGPLAWLRRRLVRRLARVARTGFALREHPKFALVQVLDRVRGVALDLGAELVRQGRIARAEDVFHLHVAELRAALQHNKPLHPLIAQRVETMAADALRRPPLAMTEQGEILTPPRPKDLPPGAMSGVAASAGVVEGVARVVLDPNKEVLHAGEILVAPFTDPGWTPLFVHAAGLITEVGGLMTHGSVVAREYGIPAVVSVSEATTRIRTGDRIRVDGTRGLVQILPAP